MRGFARRDRGLHLALQSGRQITDDIGWRATTDPVTWPGFHATVLHLLGIDHERLTWYHNGIERRLTNVHGHVITDLLS